MKKIKGYPVVINGKYFATRQGQKEEEEEKNGDVKKMLVKSIKYFTTNERGVK